MRQNKHRLLKKVILFLVENKELKTWKSILKIKHSTILPKYWNAEMVTRLRLGEDDCRAKRVGYGHEIIFCGCNGTIQNKFVDTDLFLGHCTCKSRDEHV